jgi:outer membrane protein assembly factor BamB
MVATALSFGLPNAGAHAATAARQPLWLSTYDGPAGQTDIAEAMVASPDGIKVFVTGKSPQDDSTNDDYATVAYDATTGAQVWVQRYDGPVSGDDEPTAIAMSPDGTRVFVTGASQGQDFANDYATVAYDAVAGEEVWVARYAGVEDGHDHAKALVVSPDGTTVYVTGDSWAGGFATNYDYATVAYDAVTGTEKWVVREPDSDNSSSTSNSVAVSPDGANVYVTGGGVDSDYATIAYDALTGAALWTQLYHGPANFDDVAHSVAVSPDGTKVFVTGQSYSGGLPDGGLYDYATIAYDATTGDSLWVHRYDGRAGHDDIPNDLGLSPDGTTVFVTGQSSAGQDGFGIDTWDYATVAYDALTGHKKWSRRFDSPKHDSDVAVALAVSPDGGRLFVTGYSGSDAYHDDYVTFVYSAATGHPLWMRRLHGEERHGDDTAADVAISPDGTTLFVTGFTGVIGFFDYMTAAYAVP